MSGMKVSFSFLTFFLTIIDSFFFLYFLFFFPLFAVDGIVSRRMIQIGARKELFLDIYPIVLGMF